MRSADVHAGAAMKRAYLFLLSLTLVLTGCARSFDATAPTSAAFTSLADYQRQKLDWSTCHDFFQCAYLKVPIDYTNLATGTFSIAVVKYPALKPQRRLGSIVVNPGGPGGSGVDYALGAEYIFDIDILDRYDIVGFDPRGVSRSAPIDCLNDQQTDDAYAVDTKPDSQAEIDTYIEQSKEYVATCLSKNKYLTHYSTADAARDMDILRAALGERKLNYMGKSYGTYLGTLYAQFFPNNVGKFVLDGAIDPNIGITEQNITQAIGFDVALDAFIDDCYTQSDCTLPQPRSEAIKAIQSLFQAAATKPLQTNTNRLATESLLVLGTASALYDNESGWPNLRKALKEAQQGKGDTFLHLADLYTGRDENGRYTNNEYDSGIVIDCLDWREPRNTEEMVKDAQLFAERAPVFGPYLAYSGLTCSEFPPAPIDANTRATNTITSITTPTPVIIIGVTRDPATPYEWSVGLSKIFTNSILISLNADGHTGQGRGSTCVDDIVDEYLLSRTISDKDMICSNE